MTYADAEHLEYWCRFEELPEFIMLSHVVYQMQVNQLSEFGYVGYCKILAKLKDTKMNSYE